MAKIKVTRKAYTRKDGTKVKGATYYTEDKGQPGKTPESKKWYEHNIEMNWHKEDSSERRRANALRAHGGDDLATGRALQALSNVTTDSETKKLAKSDAEFFFSQHSK